MNFTTAAIINWHGKAARAVYIVDKVGVRGQLMAKELEVKNLKKHKSSSLYRDWEANFHAISRLPWAAAMTTSKMGAWWGRIEKDRGLLLTPWHSHVRAGSGVWMSLHVRRA